MRRALMACLGLLVIAPVWYSPAWAVEKELAGVRLGMKAVSLLSRPGFGQPDFVGPLGASNQQQTPAVSSARAATRPGAASVGVVRGGPGRGPVGGPGAGTMSAARWSGGGGNRSGPMRGPGGAFGQAPEGARTRMLGAASPSYRVELTQMGPGAMRGRGLGDEGGGPGMGPRGAMGGPGMNANRARMFGGPASARSSRVGGLPPLGGSAVAGATASKFVATAVVDNQAVGFSRDCVLSYEGISFTLHDMRVMRIHVSE